MDHLLLSRGDLAPATAPQNKRVELVHGVFKLSALVELRKCGARIDNTPTRRPRPICFPETARFLGRTTMWRATECIFFRIGDAVVF